MAPAAPPPAGSPETRPLDELEQVVARLIAGLDPDRRFLLGVTGPPGVGKSTVAARIAALADPVVPAVVAPMDGFHRSDAQLAAMGLLPLKGVPDSFDADGFVARLARLRAHPPHATPWPTYDRRREAVVPGGVTVRSDHRLVVVEGNYLLLDLPPWDRVRPRLDAVWYLDAPMDILLPRLLARQGRTRSPEAAAQKVASTDVPNAEVVAAHRDRADLILTAAG